MIDRASIVNWGATHPWPRQSFIEQDIVICRAIVSIYSDPLLAKALAFRGGAALLGTIHHLWRENRAIV